MRLIFAFTMAGALLFAEEFHIRTIAGNGDPSGPTAGATAQGSPAGSGWAVAFDSHDRLHVTTIAGEVWRVDFEGKWERLWKAEGGAILFGLAIDRQSRVFVSDLLTGKVYRIDQDGSTAVIAENLNLPTGLAVDSGGNLFISEPGRIRRVNSEGVVSTYHVGTREGALSIDKEGNLYLANFVESAVQKIAPDRSVTKIAEGTALSVTACPDQNVYFTDMYRLMHVAASGAEVIAGSTERVFAVEEGPAAEARFVTPLASACDSLGRVVVFDASAARLRMISRAY